MLLCIQTGRTINDPSRFHFYTDQLYFKSPEEMKQNFAWCPEAIANTVEVAARCNLELELGKHYFPTFPMPEGRDPGLALRARQPGRAWKSGFAQMRSTDALTPEQEKIYRDRLEMEIGVIKKMGFPGYFLIVADFINWAKDQQIPVGPGPRLRGRQPGRLLHADHRSRSHALWPDLRALSEYRADVACPTSTSISARNGAAR